MSFSQRLKVCQIFLLSPSGLTFLEQLLFLAISMFSYSLIINKFSLEIAGVWALTTALMTLAHNGDLWSKGLLSFMGEERGKREMGAAVTYAATCLWSSIIGYFMLFSLSSAIIHLFSPLLFKSSVYDELQSLFWLMVISYWAIACSNNILQSLIGFGKPRLASVLKIFSSFLFLLGVILLQSEVGLETIFLAQALQGIIIFCCGLFIHFRFLASFQKHMRWEKKIFLNLINFGSNIFVVNLLNSLTEPLVKVLIANFYGNANLAIFEIANKIILGVRAIILSIGNLIITSLAKYNSKNIGGAINEFINISIIITNGTLTSFAFLFIFSPHVEFLFLSAEQSHLDAFPFTGFMLIISFCWILNSFSAPAYFLLFATRKPHGILFSELIKLLSILCIAAVAELLNQNVLVMVGLLAGFCISAIYLNVTACKKLGIKWTHVFLKIANEAKTPFALFIYSVGCLVALGELNQANPLSEMLSPYFLYFKYLLGPLIFIIFTFNFGNTRKLVDLIAQLKS